MISIRDLVEKSPETAIVCLTGETVYIVQIDAGGGMVETNVERLRYNVYVRT